MDRVTKAEFFDALIIVRMYVEQQSEELEMLKKTASPFITKNMFDFIYGIGLSTRAVNILCNCCSAFFRKENTLHHLPAYRICELPVSEIKRARNSGKATVLEIENALKDHGISLRY